MSKIQWEEVRDKYATLLPRVATRFELNDVMWEMQGELCTSHAYVFGGDIKRTNKNFHIGKLGVEVSYDKKSKSYIVEKILKGDIWNSTTTSPFNYNNTGLKVGDKITQIAGQVPDQSTSIGQHLLNCGGQEVEVKIQAHGSKEQKVVNLKTLHTEQPIYYREWVDHNRHYVEEKNQRASWLCSCP